MSQAEPMNKRTRDVIATRARERLAEPDVPEGERRALQEAYDDADHIRMWDASSAVAFRGVAFIIATTPGHALKRTPGAESRLLEFDGTHSILQDGPTP